MAKRNRKRRVEGFALPVPFTGFVIIVVILSLVHVYITNCCDALGNEIAVLEKKKNELLKQLSYEECKWARMCSSEGIEKAMERFNINMDLPDLKIQVVRIQVSELPSIEIEDEVQPQYAKMEKDPY